MYFNTFNDEGFQQKTKRCKLYVSVCCQRREM